MDGERDRQQLARVARGPWSLEYVSDWDRKDDPTAAFLSTPLVPGQSEATSVDLTQLKYQDQFAGDSLQVSARLFNGRFVSLEKLDFFGSFYETRGVSQWHGVELRLVETALAGHTLMLGFEGQQTPMLDQGGKGLVFSASNFFIQSPGYRVGVYAQDEWRIAERWSATVGLRVDRNNITDDKASPRAGLIWQATPATTIKALYGRAYRAPNAYERDYQDGHSQVANPELTSERIDTEELAADQRVGRDLALRASVYRWSMRNLINLGIDPANGIPQQQQVGGKVKARGLELSADKTWDNGARLRGSVALQYAAYISGAPLLNSPKMLDKLNLSAPLPLAGLRAGYELSYDSQRLSRDGTPLGGYTLSNLTLETESLAKGLEVSLSVFNLFDKRYQQTADDTNYQNAFVQDGRSVRLALRQRF
jgi:iron complex outermembrane receptor protein